jgi:hypothetical protein
MMGVNSSDRRFIYFYQIQAFCDLDTAGNRYIQGNQGSLVALTTVSPEIEEHNRVMVMSEEKAWWYM